MTDKEREEAIEDIENILILHGIAPGEKSINEIKR